MAKTTGTPYAYSKARGLVAQQVYNFVLRNPKGILSRDPKILVDFDELDELYSTVAQRKLANVTTQQLEDELASRS